MVILTYSQTHMAKVISVLNSKGGCGKSTISTNLARSLQLKGYQTLLVDSDPQGTARDWREMQPDRDILPVVGIDKYKSFKRNLRQVSESFDVVIIDGAARLHKIVASAVKASDLVLIPVQPSAADLWPITELEELVVERQILTDGSPNAAFVISRQIVGTNLASEIGEVLSDSDLPTLEGRTSQRVAYTKALNAGLSVLDLDASSKAAKEVQTITDEVVQWLKEV